MKTISYVRYWGTSSLGVRMIYMELNRVKVLQRNVVLEMKEMIIQGENYKLCNVLGLF